MNRSPTNPFTVQTPEDIAAADAMRLFVDVFTDFYKIRDPGHSMLNGPRGCGKSMMFRYLQPDCQRLSRNCTLKELPFFAVLVSIKNTFLNLTEFQRLHDHPANAILNEHFLTMFVASKAFAALEKENIADSKRNRDALRRFYGRFVSRLRLAGWNSDGPTISAKANASELFAQMKNICDELYRDVIRFVRRLSFAPSTESFSGPLCGYLDFLLPTFESMPELPFMPNAPIYLLIDDADYLNITQTRILNSWVATRTSRTASIKISTQLKYKTYEALSGLRIESPHDYSEVNISDIYTSSKSRYLKRVEEIVEKRLKHAGVKSSPRDFFPPDAEQDKAIAEIGNKLRVDWKKAGRGNRPSDDSVRYARPIYIAGLGGLRKASSKYSYAGFEQLVHISSGLVRYFLEPAAQMFSEEQSQDAGKPVEHIRPKVQDEVIRASAENLMFTEYEKIFKEEHLDPKSVQAVDNKARLHNLIRGLGGLFHEKLISQDSERRVFSIAFSDQMDPKIADLFNLGIQFGYFHRSTIGNKDGTGRTPLYVLTRRLAPYFNLDPNGFAGYLFVTNDRIWEAIHDPDKFLRKVKAEGTKAGFDERQLQLFQ